MKELGRTQRLLESLSPKPLPAELKEKILAVAYQKRRKSLVIAPALRTAYFLCFLLIILALASDNIMTKSENERLTAVIDTSQNSEAVKEKEFQKVMAELFEIENDKALTQWLIHHYKINEESAKLMSFQSMMNRLKEEINGI
jgi:hypothetical protein